MTGCHCKNYYIVKFSFYVPNLVNVCYYNNYTCRFIVGICFVYMGEITNYLISFLFNKTENVMYMSFYSENSLLLLYVTRIKVNQSNMKVS